MMEVLGRGVARAFPKYLRLEWRADDVFERLRLRLTRSFSGLSGAKNGLFSRAFRLRSFVSQFLIDTAGGAASFEVLPRVPDPSRFLGRVGVPAISSPRYVVPKKVPS